MIILRSIISAFACFSAIPVPSLEWDEANMRYMMAAFPLVGVVIGLCVCLWSVLCQTCGFSTILLAAGFTLIPILVSGAIHLDGFGDVIDAASSHASPDRRREILKDPHVGVFAVIGVVCYILAYFAFASEVDASKVLALGCIPVLSRCLSGFATVSFAGSASNGMLAAEREASSPAMVRTALVVLFALAGALLIWRVRLAGVLMLAAAVLVLWGVKVYADRNFNGMSGDMAGFFLQAAELAMLIVLVLF